MDFTVKDAIPVKEEDWRELLRKRFANKTPEEKPWEKPQPQEEKKRGFLMKLAEVGKSEEKKVEGILGKILESGKECIGAEKVLKAKVSIANKIKSGNEAEVTKQAKKAVKEDVKIWKEVSSILAQLEELTGDEFKRKIRSMFAVGFKDAGSRNTLVFTPKEKGYKTPAIVIGPEGFQLRPYVQARPIGNFAEIQYIVNNKDEIIKEMKSRRNLKGRVTKFEKFCDLMPKVVKGGQSVVKLKKDVLMPVDYSSMPFRVIDKMAFTRYEHFEVWSKSEDEVSLGRGNAVRFDGYMDWDDAVVYLQVRDQLPRALEELKATANPSIQVSEQAIEKIQELFARELLLNNI